MDSAISSRINWFSCRFCSVRSSSLWRYLKHLRNHRHLSRLLFCGVSECELGFRTETSLRIHIIRNHGIFTNRQLPTSTSTLHESNSRGTYDCTLQSCLKTMDSYHDLIKHVKNHMRTGLSVKCPISQCSKFYSHINSFTGHLSKCHRTLWNITSHNPEEPLVFSNGSSGQSEPFFDIVGSDSSSDLLEDIIAPEQNEPDSNEDPFLLCLSQFYMKLEYEYLIAGSTVQYIAQEIKNVIEEDHKVLKKKIVSRLKQECVDPSVINEILETVFDCAEITKCHDELKSGYKRKQFYQKHFPFVKPQKKSFVSSDGKEKFFYYVPIPETIKALFRDKSIKLDFKTSPPSQDEVYRDFSDGYVYKNNQFFKDNPNSLQLILYQDAFEVVTPIGPAKKKHKLLGVYLSIGNIPEHLRSHINSIYLVALCKEKNFEHNQVFGPIVDDLLELEDNGVNIPEHGNVKGSLVCILGDNLGSHGIGGYVENFSRSIYFCRYCLIDRRNFNAPHGEKLRFPLRTVESYKDAVRHVQRTQAAYKGIKYDSVFNRLKWFHVVCGLPPCLAHDLFEGIISHDLMLCIDYFVEQGWFTYSTLQKCMENFPYSSEDMRDKPITIEETWTKIQGGAMQVATFLRLFPLIVLNYIKDFQDPVWKLVLQMIEIVEIIMAPAIHKSAIGYLQTLCEDYISSRRDLFPATPLRCKHHYLSHYALLILAFGPLVKVFTLRFESKHTFFKRLIRVTRNFINVMFTLSMKHELFQSFLRTGANRKSPVCPVDPVPFEICRYSQEIQEAVRKNKHVDGESQECSSITIKGAAYRKGSVVALRQDGLYSDVQMGRICLILISSSFRIYFLVEVLKTDFLPPYHAYRLQERLGYECILCTRLMSYQPLHVYVKSSMQLVRSKHAFVCRPL